jgi:hypothetical protein
VFSSFLPSVLPFLPPSFPPSFLPSFLQERVIMVTNKAIYNLMPTDYKKCKRRVPFVLIDGVTISKVSTNLFSTDCEYMFVLTGLFVLVFFRLTGLFLLAFSYESVLLTGIFSTGWLISTGIFLRMGSSYGFFFDWLDFFLLTGILLRAFLHFSYWDFSYWHFTVFLLAGLFFSY